MRRIILCEGETDATLIGLYLGNLCGWKYKDPKNKIINIPEKQPSDNKVANHYFIENDSLVICAVGGKDNFGGFFEKYIYPMIKSSNKVEKTYRIAVITDADDRSVSDIETDILSQLSFCIQSLSNNTWTPNSCQVDFDDNVSVDFLLSVIPKTGTGALETVLLDAMSEESEGKLIVDSSIEFVDKTYQRNYQIHLL